MAQVLSYGLEHPCVSLRVEIWASSVTSLTFRDWPVCCSDRCVSPPYVENATAVFHPDLRSVVLTCIKGHRFPTGERHYTAQCHQDGSWQRIHHCKSTYVYSASQTTYYAVSA